MSSPGFARRIRPWLVQGCAGVGLLALFALSALPAAREMVSFPIWFGFMPRLGGPTVDAMATSRYSIFHLYAHVRKNTPEDALFLVLRPMDFALYAQRRVIREVDPRMAPVLAATGVDEAADALRRMGVGYVFLPSYALATHSNSVLYRLLADPRLVTVEYDAEGSRLFKLLDTPRTVQLREVWRPLAVRWNGDPSCFAREARPRDIGQPVTLSAGWSPGAVTSGCGVEGLSPLLSGAGASVSAGAAYLLTGRLEGRGVATLSALFYDSEGNYRRSYVWQSAVGSRPDGQVATLFLAPPGARYVRLSLHLNGGYRSVSAHDLVLMEVAGTTQPPGGQEQAVVSGRVADVLAESGRSGMSCLPKVDKAANSAAVNSSGETRLEKAWRRFQYLLDGAPTGTALFAVSGKLVGDGPLKLFLRFDIPGDIDGTAVLTSAFPSPEGAPVDLAFVIEANGTPTCLILVNDNAMPARFNDVTVRRLR